MAPPLSIIKIVKYCDVWGGGGAKILQKIMAPPLSVIKIVKHCDVWGGGRQNSKKNNGAPSLSLSLRLLSIVTSGEGGAKMLQKIMVPPLSVIKINKYCSVGGGAALRERYNTTKDNGAPPPLSVIKINKYCSVVGRGGGIEGALKFYNK